MSWFTKEIPIRKEELAARLRGLPGAFQLRDEEVLYFGAYPTSRSEAVDPPGAPEPSDGPSDWPLWIGVLPYEAFRAWEREHNASGDSREEPHLVSPRWQRYGAMARASHGKVLIGGEEHDDVERLASILMREEGEEATTPGLAWHRPAESGEAHCDRVRTALSAIGRGELYQVNLARRFEFEAQGDCLSMLEALGAMAHAPFSMAIDLQGVEVVSTSPELFLDYSPIGRVVTRPIKGTRPRSSDLAEDLRLSRELDESEKEQAELAMVVDIERNDLGRIAEAGSVKMSVPPHVVSHVTVHHREAEVEAQLRSDVSREALIRAMMPSGSVTGAPKVRAMDLIAELEAERRGLYTGALGYTTRGGGLRLSMAIRVLTIREGIAHYYAGGGIVADSDPEQELAETVWKARQLRALVGSGWES